MGYWSPWVVVAHKTKPFKNCLVFSQPAGSRICLRPSLSTERSKSWWSEKKGTASYSMHWASTNLINNQIQAAIFVSGAHKASKTFADEDSLVALGRQSGKHCVCMLYDVCVCFNLCCLKLESVCFFCVWHLFVVLSFALWFCISLRALSGLSGARMKFEWHPGNAKRCGWQDNVQSVERCWSTLMLHI